MQDSMYMYVSVFCVYTPPMVVYVLDILDWLWNFYCFRFILWYTIFVNFFLKSEHWYFFISWDSNLSQDSNNVDKSIFFVWIFHQTECGSWTFKKWHSCQIFVHYKTIFYVTFFKVKLYFDLNTNKTTKKTVFHFCSKFACI